jgi:hypothetical protein
MECTLSTLEDVPLVFKGCWLIPLMYSYQLGKKFLVFMEQQNSLISSPKPAIWPHSESLQAVPDSLIIRR